MSSRLLEATDLDVRLADQLVLRGIAVTARAGEPMAVTGPSGSGKSVLLHALAGLVPVDRGRVLVDGVDRRDLVGSDRPSIGVILQSHGLASGLTAEENIAMPLQCQGLSRGDIAARCAEALAAVDLEHLADRLVEQLSGGQRQRVAVARALAGRPAIVLADEPTAELDAVNRSLVLSALLRQEPERIVLIASNDPEVVAVCRTELSLHEGAVAPSEGDPDHRFDLP